MNREDAYYFMIMLASGLDEEYNAWLDDHLETEEPLSDITYELSLCGSDVNKAVSCLKNYRTGESVDERAVSERLRLFLKNSYNSNRFSKKEIVAYMHRFSKVVGDPCDFEIAVWTDMYYMDDYYALAEDGVISWEKFDSMFFAFLNEGIEVDRKHFWDNM